MEESNQVRRIICFLLRVLVILVILGILVYQWVIHDLYRQFDGYVKFGDRLLPYQSVGFVALAAILALLRQKLKRNTSSAIPAKQGKTQKQFWLCKMILWTAAFFFWLIVWIKELFSAYDYGPWYDYAGWYTVFIFGYSIVAVYAAEILWKCWRELRDEWCSDQHSLWTKPLYSLKIILFSGIASAKTLPGKVFSAAVFLFGCYLMFCPSYSTWSISQPFSVISQLFYAFSFGLLEHYLISGTILIIYFVLFEKDN